MLFIIAINDQYSYAIDWKWSKHDLHWSAIGSGRSSIDLESTIRYLFNPKRI